MLYTFAVFVLLIKSLHHVRTMGRSASGILSGVTKKKFFEVRYEEDAHLCIQELLKWFAFRAGSEAITGLCAFKWFNVVQNLFCFTETTARLASIEIRFRSLSDLNFENIKSCEIDIRLFCC